MENKSELSGIMKGNHTLTKEQESDYQSLSTDEKRIYDSLMRSFPATSPDSTFNHAIQGGIKFQFIQK